MVAGDANERPNNTVFFVEYWMQCIHKKGKQGQNEKKNRELHQG